MCFVSHRCILSTNKTNAVPGIWNIWNAFALYSSITLADEIWLSVLCSSIFKPQTRSCWHRMEPWRPCLEAFSLHWVCVWNICVLYHVPALGIELMHCTRFWGMGTKLVAKSFLPYNKTNAEIHLCLVPFLHCVFWVLHWVFCQAYKPVLSNFLLNGDCKWMLLSKMGLVAERCLQV